MFLLSVCGRQRGIKEILGKIFPQSCQVFVTACRVFLIILEDAAGWLGWQKSLNHNLKSERELGEREREKEKEAQTQPLIFKVSLDSGPEQMHHPSESGFLLICQAAAGGVCLRYLVEHLLHARAPLRVNTLPLEGRPNEGKHRTRCYLKQMAINKKRAEV